MPTKADRKHLDATVSAFHSHYASDANWGTQRWHESLYPALARPTRYSALVNQYVPRVGLDKNLFSTVPEDELRQIQLPKLPTEADHTATVTTRPGILLYERVQPTTTIETEEEEEESFLFTAPQPVPSPSSPEKELLSHWNMDAASALCAHMLNVQPNDKVLDLCAAPGGKSVALAQLIFPHLHADPRSSSPSSLGCLHSNELDHARNKRLSSNLRSYLPAPLFETNAVRVLLLDGSDARAVTQLPCGPGGYDRVLLDAPCSSERHIIHAHLKASSGGRIADEMARWRRGGSKTLSRLQADLLMTALRAVRTGGRVVYSTCSIETGENDGVVEKMLTAPGGASDEEEQEEVDGALEMLTEETKYGRIAVPDHKAGGQWGPLYLCVITKVARKV
ncbi:S-adenosyl-L-methionine-dependent methyltransferase [Cryphonectria parasitica EP155]|uniref:NOL1/NOP2/Sun domain family member 4 n=1 Tax=Cryphonectria parasitica (strain ATCC 38755 / EP155) TaxID=660469 RepID=A0A9P5CK36_CRYP1|nr:S-adenosyl-L-methionine-dependent methyltransferase [Cryphonectria parasitica EP155]KAF3760551.1 S-adenosyl-L-methionine-dependent methyltransferase [Cryphonectria parasitica EP155]